MFYIVKHRSFPRSDCFKIDLPEPGKHVVDLTVDTGGDRVIVGLFPEIKRSSFRPRVKFLHAEDRILRHFRHIGIFSLYLDHTKHIIRVFPVFRRCDPEKIRLF